MKNWTILFLSMLLISSCASMLNHDYVRMDIHTTAPTIIIHDQDTIETERNKASLYLERSTRRLNIEAHTDTIHKTIKVKSRLSPAFYLNVFWIYGVLIDRRSDRVFEYPTSIQLDMSNTLPIYYSYGIPEKKQIYFNLSIPNINTFLVDPYEWTPPKPGISYLGIGASLDYYYKNNRFLNLGFSHAGGLFSSNRNDGFEDFSSTYLSITNNHRLHRWSFGYGLSFGTTHWAENLKMIDEFGSSSNSFLYKDNENFGAIFNSYLHLTQRLYLGLVYRPSFIEVEPSFQMKYEHLISVEFLFKFQTRR